MRTSIVADSVPRTSSGPPPAFARRRSSENVKAKRVRRVPGLAAVCDPSAGDCSNIQAAAPGTRYRRQLRDQSRRQHGDRGAGRRRWQPAGLGGQHLAKSPLSATDRPVDRWLAPCGPSGSRASSRHHCRQPQDVHQRRTAAIRVLRRSVVAGVTGVHWRAHGERGAVPLSGSAAPAIVGRIYRLDVDFAERKSATSASRCRRAWPEHVHGQKGNRIPVEPREAARTATVEPLALNAMPLDESIRVPGRASKM